MCKQKVSQKILGIIKKRTNTIMGKKCVLNINSLLAKEYLQMTINYIFNYQQNIQSHMH